MQFQTTTPAVHPSALQFARRENSLLNRTQVRLEYFGVQSRRAHFVFIDPSGEGLPLLSTSRAYRQTIYRNPLDPKQAADALARRWCRREARCLVASGSAA